MRTHETRQARPRQASSDPARLRALRAFGIQTRLRVNAPGDVYEQEAERIAAKVTRMPEPAVQRTCSCGGECPDCKAKRLEEEAVQTRSIDEADFGSREAPASVQEALRAPGRPLDRSTETFFSSRFRHDFRNVRVHTDEAAERSARELRASAYTVGRDIVFAPGQYAPGTDAGRRLLAHELTHVVQQRGRSGVVQREEEDGEDVTTPRMKMFPSTKGTPCACLVHIHNEERKARRTAQVMQEHCPYNLLLVEPDTRLRNLPLPGGWEVDPNSLFSKDIMNECIGKPSCPTHAWESPEVKLQRQFFMEVQSCSEEFQKPVIALHNNSTKDTENYQQLKKSKRAKLKGTIDKSLESGPGSWKDVTKRLGDLKYPVKDDKGNVVLDAEGNEVTENVKPDLVGKNQTNIFGWCGLSENTKCHIGNPDQPDHLIWVTSASDFDRLSQEDVNVVLQTREPVEKNSVGKSDLSTLFVLIGASSKAQGANPRYMNIETPGRKVSDDIAADYLFIKGVLDKVGLDCCDADAASIEADLTAEEE